MDSGEEWREVWVHYYDPEPGSLSDLRDRFVKGLPIKKSELVEALQSHRARHIPGEIAPLICGFLTRDIKSRRGRHARRKDHMEFYVEAMTAIYKEELARLRKLKKEHGSLRGLVPPTLETRDTSRMAVNEIAAALVAQKCPQLNISGRRVQNLISAHKKSKRK
jgi:hypothetical protein